MRLLSLLLLAACAPPPGTDDPVDTDTVDTEPPQPQCALPAWSAPYSAAGATPLLVAVQRAPAQVGPAGRFELRPVDLTATGAGEIELTVEKPFKLYDSLGAPLTTPMRVSSTDLPLRLLVGTRKEGAAVLRATPVDTEDCAAAELTLQSTVATPLTARAVAASPGAIAERLFSEDDTVDLLIDPALAADRIGLTGKVHVVLHRTPEAWDLDPTLENVGDTVETVVLGPAWSDGLLTIAEGDLAPRRVGHPRGFDVVVDFGDDGRLDPGDLIAGFGTDPAFHVAGDLSSPGPYTVSTRRVNGPGFWIDEELFWPSDLPGELRPAPLLVVSHGNGHDLAWYDHIGNHLASWGFVVMSHKNNTEPGVEQASLTTIQNTEWFLANRETVAEGALAGLVDPTRIAWIGHSRGGEGVVRAWRKIESGSQVPTAFTLDDIRAVGSIAPTVFQGVGPTNPGDVPYLMIVGGADGDVTGGADCPLCQSMRIAGAALGDVRMVNFQGASHNVFHNGRGSFDDGQGPRQLVRSQVHPVLNGLLLAWVGEYLLEHPGYAELLKAMPDQRQPQAVRDEVTTTWLRRGPIDSQGLTLDTFQTEPDVAVASSGASVACSGAGHGDPGVTLVESELDDNNLAFAWQPADVANGMTISHADGFQRGGILTWEAPGACTWTPTSPLDLRTWTALELSLARTTRHPSLDTAPGPLTFELELEDAVGNTVRLPTSLAGTVPAPYPRQGLGGGEGWGNEWATIRLPVQAFVMAGALDLSSVVAVRVVVGQGGTSAAGQIGIDDLGFTR